MPLTLFFISLTSEVITFSSALYMLRFLNWQMRLLLIYFGVAVITELLLAYMGSQGMNNLWLARVFSIVEFCLLTIVFSSWQNNKLLKRLLHISIPLMVVLGIFSTLYLENIRHFNSFSKPITSLILIMVSAYTLVELNKEKIDFLFREPRFWFSSGVLFSFSASLLLHALSNSLLHLPMSVVRLIFESNVVLSIIANIIYTGGFLCQTRTR